jgi:TRAP-type C4-dicarboxylate transport system permease small subunit
VANKSGFDTNVSSTTLSETIGKIIRVVLVSCATVFLALTVYAGILWLTAGGNEEKVTKANHLLYSGVIGLIIIFAAYGITTFVMWAVLSGASGGEQTCPWGPGTC